MGITLISSQTLGSNTGTITFSSIPQTYDHLYMLISTRTTSASFRGYITMRFNNNNDTNQSSGGLIQELGTTKNQQAWTGILMLTGTDNSNFSVEYSSTEIWIPCYTSTSHPKIVMAHSGYLNSTSGNSMLSSTYGFLNSSVAISTIYFDGQGVSYSSGSTFNLYGVN